MKIHLKDSFVFNISNIYKNAVHQKLKFYIHLVVLYFQQQWYLFHFIYKNHLLAGCKTFYFIVIRLQLRCDNVTARHIFSCFIFITHFYLEIQLCKRTSYNGFLQLNSVLFHYKFNSVSLCYKITKFTSCMSGTFKSLTHVFLAYFANFLHLIYFYVS